MSPGSRFLMTMLFAVCMIFAHGLPAAVPFGREWAATWDLGSFNDRGQSIATDSAGNVYVAARDSQASYLRKYSPTGTPLWSRTAVTTQNSFVAFIDWHVVVDSSDSPILAGSITANDGTLQDFVVVKFDPAGTQLWLRRFDADNNNDVLTAVAVDEAGNIYAHGSGHNSGPRNIYTVKYDPDGTPLWVASYTPHPGDNLSCDVAVHSDGSVYVLGSTTAFGTDDDIILVKYDALGEQLWLRRYNGDGASGFTDDWPSRLKLDADGSAYLVGYSEPSNGGGYGVVTQKYLADGTLAWTRRYDVGPPPSTGDFGVRPSGLAIDASGQVYISGQIANHTAGSTGVDVVTIKYAADGTPLWSSTYNGDLSGADEPRDLVLTPDGSVFVLARSLVLVQGQISPFEDERMLLLQYDTDGALLSTDIDSESADGSMLARREDSIYIVGTSSTITIDVTVRKYSPSVTIVASDPIATEAGTTTGELLVTRGGSTVSALTVNFTIAGSATNGSDYTTITSPVTIPAGSASTTITITPIDDTDVESDETAMLSLTSGTGYGVGSPSTAAVTIQSDDLPPPFLTLGTVTSTPITGNGDGVLDPGENGLLTIPIQNAPATSAATSVIAMLTTSTAGVAIINGTSAYPTIAGGSSETNITAFTFSVAPSVACGTALQFTLTVTYAESPTSAVFSFSVLVGALGSPATVSYIGPPIPILDGVGANLPGAVASVPLAVSGFTGEIADLNFRFDGTACSATFGSTTVGLDHSFVGDLVIRLTSPHGTTVSLIDRMDGGSNDGRNFCNTVLDDSGTSSIETVSPALNPFSGTFLPANPLSAFNGENPNGTWTLEAQDFYNADSGSVRAFSLVITAAACTACDTFTTSVFPASSGTVLVTTAQNCTGGYSTGTAVAISASPASGFGFTNWMSTNCTLADANALSTTCTMTGAGNATVTANFTSVTIVPPANVVATAQSATSIALTWIAVPGATEYEIWRAADGAASSLLTVVGPVTATTDLAVIAGHTYVYRMRTRISLASSGFSNNDLATTVIFADDPLVAGTTTVKAVHLTALRTAVNAVRVTAGLAPMTFTDSTITAASTPIRKVHIEELRGAMTPALTALGFPAPALTDPTLVVGGVVKAAHVQELRSAVK